MHTRIWRSIGCAALLSAALTQAYGESLPPDELCRRRLDRMLAAQTCRLIEEVKKCSERVGDAEAFATSCLPFLGEDDNLHADEARLDIALTRVERHGDDKFPRKCTGMTPDFFEPACFAITDSRVQLRRCVYNDHTLDVLVDLVEASTALPQECRTRTLHLAKLAWRDWIQDDDDRALERGPARLRRKCDSTDHWAVVADAIRSRSLSLRQIVLDE